MFNFILTYYCFKIDKFSRKSIKFRLIIYEDFEEFKFFLMENY